MGTRGYYVLRLNGTFIVIFNHYDSYPSWLGHRLVKVINTSDLEQWKLWIPNLIILGEDAKTSPEMIEKARQTVCEMLPTLDDEQLQDLKRKYTITSEDVSTPEAFRCWMESARKPEQTCYSPRSDLEVLMDLLQNPTRLHWQLKWGYASAERTVMTPRNDLFIEWVYIIDLDRDVFTIRNGSSIDMSFRLDSIPPEWQTIIEIPPTIHVAAAKWDQFEEKLAARGWSGFSISQQMSLIQKKEYGKIDLDAVLKEVTFVEGLARLFEIELKLEDQDVFVVLSAPKVDPSNTSLQAHHEAQPQVAPLEEIFCESKDNLEAAKLWIPLLRILLTELVTTCEDYNDLRDLHPSTREFQQVAKDAIALCDISRINWFEARKRSYLDDFRSWRRGSDAKFRAKSPSAAFFTDFPVVVFTTHLHDDEESRHSAVGQAITECKVKMQETSSTTQFALVTSISHIMVVRIDTDKVKVSDVYPFVPNDALNNWSSTLEALQIIASVFAVMHSKSIPHPTIKNGKYTIKKIISSGFDNAILLTENSETRSACVLKIMYSHERWTAECRAYHALKGTPGTLTLLDSFQNVISTGLGDITTTLSTCVFAEICEPITDLSPPEVLEMVKQVSSILNKLDTNRLTHGDVKPLNIVRHNGRYILIDYETSEQIRDGVRFDPPKFTHGFQAPRGCGMKSDWASLLLTAYWFLEGTQYMGDAGKVRALEELSKAEGWKGADVPENLLELCGSLVEKAKLYGV